MLYFVNVCVIGVFVVVRVWMMMMLCVDGDCLLLCVCRLFGMLLMMMMVKGWDGMGVMSVMVREKLRVGYKGKKFIVDEEEDDGDGK